MNVDFESVQTMGQMTWSLADVAREGHPNAGMTVLERMEKYGIDPEGGAVSYNRLMRIERDEAVKAGLAPVIPITPETARTFAPYIEEWKRARLRRYVIIAAVGVGAYLVLRRRK